MQEGRYYLQGDPYGNVSRKWGCGLFYDAVGCSRTLLAQRRERFVASVAGSSVLSVLNLTVNIHSETVGDGYEGLHTERFKWKNG
jgi:hypothetical protein